MGSHCCSSHCHKPHPLQLGWIPGDVKDRHTSLPFIFSFFPFASQTLKIRTFFKLHVWGKLESDHTCLRKVSEKIWEDLKFKFTPHTGPPHRDSYNNQISKKIYKQKPPKQTTANTEKDGESDFQRYHIIRFKCPVWPTQWEKIRHFPWKGTDDRYTRQRY